MRSVLRRKTFATSLCGAERALPYGYCRRGATHHYKFDRDCFCPSPERHAAQFMGVVGLASLRPHDHEA